MEYIYNYTFIIPHYNVPDLLQRCLDSIPQRNDVQVIVVDDNSNPDIVDFSRFPGLERENTEVVLTKEGKGAGYARNVALKCAKGKWLIFSDSDDVFTTDINTILEDLQTENSDILYFNVCSKDIETMEYTEESNDYNSKIEHAIATTPDFLRHTMEVPWGKAIRKSLVDRYNIDFEEVRFSNDTRFSLLCGYYANSVNVTNVKGYTWMRRSGSLWRNVDLNWCVTRFFVHLRMVEFYLKHSERVLARNMESTVLSFLFMLKDISYKDFARCFFLYAVKAKRYKYLFIRVPYYSLMAVLKSVFLHK